MAFPRLLAKGEFTQPIGEALLRDSVCTEGLDWTIHLSQFPGGPVAFVFGPPTDHFPPLFLSGLESLSTLLIFITELFCQRLDPIILSARVS